VSVEHVFFDTHHSRGFSDRFSWHLLALIEKGAIYAIQAVETEMITSTRTTSSVKTRKRKERRKGKASKLILVIDGFLSR
jgi:hypothetical protein